MCEGQSTVYITCYSYIAPDRSLYT